MHRTSGLWRINSGGHTSRGTAGLFLNALSVSIDPGGTSAPSNACLAADHSPRWTRASARVMRCFNPRSVRLRRDLAVAALDAQSCPASINACHSRTNISNLATNFGFLITLPRPGRCKSNRGDSKNNFHPLSSVAMSLVLAPFKISSNATRRACRKGPLKNRGTFCIRQPLCSNASCNCSTSNDLNPNWQVRTPGRRKRISSSTSSALSRSHPNAPQ